MVVAAEVRAVSKETGAVLSARTNDAGSYTLPYLLPGVYDLTAAFTGFKKTGRSDVAVRVNDVLTIEFRLEVGNATESVEVSGGAPLVEASNVTLGQVVEERQIKDLPLAGRQCERARAADAGRGQFDQSPSTQEQLQ